MLAQSILVTWTAIVFLLSGRDVLHPAFLLSIIWTTGVLLCNTSDMFYPLQQSTIATIAFYVMLSSISALAYRFVMPPSRLEFRAQAFNGKVLHVAVGVSLVGCFWFLAKFVHEMLSYDSLAHYFYYARVADMNGEPLVSLNWFEWQIPPLAFVSSLFCLYFSLSDERKKMTATVKPPVLVLLLLLTGISLSITGTRSVLIVFLLMLMLVYLGRRRPSFKTAFIALSLFCLFYATTVYFMRATETEKESQPMSVIMEKHFVLYGAGGIKGFEGFLTNNVIVNHPPIAGLLGEEVTGQMEMIDLGPNLVGNVFSAFAVYIYYFHELAPIVVASIFIIVGFIYEVRNRNPLMFVLACFATTATILTVFHDYFFSLFPYIGRAVLLYFFLRFGVKQKKSNKEKSA